MAKKSKANYGDGTIFYSNSKGKWMNQSVDGSMIGFNFRCQSENRPLIDVILWRPFVYLFFLFHHIFFG